MSTGGGLTPLTYSEIEAWARATATPIDPATAIAIRTISAAYATQTADRSKASAAPWPEAVPENVTGKLREAFAGLKRKTLKRRPMSDKRGSTR